MLKANSVQTSDFLSILDDQTPADQDSFKTGLAPDRERLLSSIFIQSDKYGTRSSTVIQIDVNEQVTFVERVFNRTSESYQDRQFQFGISK